MISEQTKLLESEDGSIDPWYADEGYPPIEARLTVYPATVVQGPMALFVSSRSPAKTFSLRCVLMTCQASTHLLVTSTAPPAFLAGITGDSPGPPAHTACAKKVVPGDPRRPALQTKSAFFSSGTALPARIPTCMRWLLSHGACIS